MRIYRFELNGESVAVEAEGTDTLVDILRRKFMLTGTKEGCGQGECGACTVLLNGKPVYACLLLIPKIEGQTVTTIEGIGEQGEPDVLQKSFVEHGAIQCGYCTPGMILSAEALLQMTEKPSRDEIRKYLSGHLCRCTGYQKIVDAVESATGEKGRIK